jgi:hypothetical protein
MADETPSETPLSVDLETVTVATAAPPQTDPFDPVKEKASGAREVARVLVFTFAATIGATFIIIALIYFRSSSPAQASEFVKAFVDVIPVMENFVTKIFGPLLAFVLGYYFGEKGKTQPTQT